MYVCVVPGNSQSKEVIASICAELLSDRHIITIGESSINKDFSGTKDDDLTNLLETNYLAGNISQQVTDAYIFIEPSLEAVKSISRILSCIEQGKLSQKKILLYKKSNWKNFMEMLKVTSHENDNRKIVQGVKIIDTLKIARFS